MLEQLYEEKARAEKLWVLPRSNPRAQVAPPSMEAFESDVGVNDDSIRVHRSRGGMNFPLLAAHHSALIPSAMRSASSSGRPLRCEISSSRSQSRNALRCFGGTAFLGIVTRTSVSVFSTVIMKTAYPLADNAAATFPAQLSSPVTARWQRRRGTGGDGGGEAKGRRKGHWRGLRDRKGDGSGAPDRKSTRLNSSHAN